MKEKMKRNYVEGICDEGSDEGNKEGNLVKEVIRYWKGIVKGISDEGYSEGNKKGIWK